MVKGVNAANQNFCLFLHHISKSLDCLVKGYSACSEAIWHVIQHFTPQPSLKKPCEGPWIFFIGFKLLFNVEMGIKYEIY